MRSFIQGTRSERSAIPQCSVGNLNEAFKQLSDSPLMSALGSVVSLREGRD